jgi:hypothetical protein
VVILKSPPLPELCGYTLANRQNSKICTLDTERTQMSPRGGGGGGE